MRLICGLSFFVQDLIQALKSIPDCDLYGKLANIKVAADE